MRLDTSQQMRIEMRLRLAPRMIQSMEILQLPLMALQERIAQELSENPMLEAPEVEPEVIESVDASGPPTDPKAEAAEKPLEQKELVVDSEHNNEADFER